MPRYLLLKDLLESGRHVLAGTTLDTDDAHPLFHMDARLVPAWTEAGWIELVHAPAPEPDTPGWPPLPTDTPEVPYVAQPGRVAGRHQPRRSR